MELKETREGDKLTLLVTGRLDTNAATKFNEATDKLLKDESVKDFVLDLAGCDYVASSGLRGILAAQKIMTSRGGMVVKNVCDSIMEVFEMTAFTDILTIE